jgi:hypothetical protein
MRCGGLILFSSVGNRWKDMRSDGFVRHTAVFCAIVEK